VQRGVFLKRKTYSKDFKVGEVNQVLQQENSVTDVAKFTNHIK